MTETNATALAILDVITADMLDVGKVQCSLSVRQIAERAGCDYSTVSRHVAGRVGRWLTVKPGRSGMSTVFRLPRVDTTATSRTQSLLGSAGREGVLQRCPSEVADGSVEGLLQPCPSLMAESSAEGLLQPCPSDRFADPSADHWVGAQHLRMAWLALDEWEATTVSAVSERRRVTSKTARRNLHDLAARGFARHDGDGGWYRTCPNEEPTHVHREERARRHEQDRLLYEERRAYMTVSAIDDDPREVEPPSDPEWSPSYDEADAQFAYEEWLESEGEEVPMTEAGAVAMLVQELDADVVETIDRRRADLIRFVLRAALEALGGEEADGAGWSSVQRRNLELQVGEAIDVGMSVDRIVRVLVDAPGRSAVEQPCAWLASPRRLVLRAAVLAARARTRDATR